MAPRWHSHQVGSPAFISPVGETIESRINGEFKGWDGETIFPLMNGQIWQQATYSYHYHYAYDPGVIIYTSSLGVPLMKVDGVADPIQVKRIR